jgi:transposase
MCRRPRRKTSIIEIKSRPWWPDSQLGVSGIPGAVQKRDPELKGLRWALLKDRRRLGDGRRADLDALLKHLTTKRTARAWQYREDLREILHRKQINVVRDMLWQWCTNVMRSKVEPMKDVARMIRNHLEGIVAWAASSKP